MKHIGGINISEGFVSSVNVNPEGGVPKNSVNSAKLFVDGVEGDLQTDTKHHGGPERAVCLFSSELMNELNREGHKFHPGSVGENLTISGIDWSIMDTGIRLSVGDSVIEITNPASPCSTIQHVFSDHSFSRISQKKNPGWSRWYARVIKEAEVFKGDSVSIFYSED